MRLGIDASNIGEGGGITHLIEFLTHSEFLLTEYGIETVVIFAAKKTLNRLPTFKGLKKVTFPAFNQGLLHRVYFQIVHYDKYIHEECDVLFSITGDYLGRFKPVVGMSRNMLLYERDIWKEIKQPKEIIRFWLNYHKQKRCFKNASGIIFISNYAYKEVAKQLNIINKQISIIHHGISPRFSGEIKPQKDISDFSVKKPFKFLYVSTVHMYKHQWNVVEAIANLRKKGYPLELDLVGGVIFEPAGQKLKLAIKKFDPNHEFIHYHGHIAYDKIDSFYKNADGIVYASTCENMPNILIESMASGLPIACSNKQPIPEFLKENGFYFNAKSIVSIEKSLEDMLSNLSNNKAMLKANLNDVRNYSWAKTTKHTLEFITQIYTDHKN